MVSPHGEREENQHDNVRDVVERELLHDEAVPSRRLDLGREVGLFEGLETRRRLLN